jgi:hypothetical protein
LDKPSAGKPPSALSEGLTPLGNLPGDIANEFGQGAKKIRGALDNKDQGVMAQAGEGAELALGGMQEFFSPLTGSVQALVTDPIKAQFPKGSKIGEIAGETAGDVATMVSPGAFAKSLESAGSLIPKIIPKYTQAVHSLMGEGVELTPGQIFHGAAKQAETVMQGAPLIGPIVQGAQTRSVESFNRAATNRALKQIGDTLPKNMEIGRDSIDYAGSAIGAKYDSLLPKLTFQGNEPQFINDIQGLRLRNVRRLTPDYQQQFESNLKDLMDRYDAHGGMDGKTFKAVDSELGHVARQNIKSLDPAQRELGYALDDLRGSMRDSLERTNPDKAKELRSVNTAWAMYSRIQAASIAKAASGGVFTPSDLLGAIKKSSSKGSFARGEGMLQDLGDAGAMVLPSSIGERSPRPSPWYAMLGGAGLGYEAFEHPLAAAAAGGVGLLPYSKGGMALASKIAKEAPAVKAAIKASVKKALPASGPLAAVSSVGGDRNRSGGRMLEPEDSFSSSLPK